MKTLKEIGEHAAIERLLPFLKKHPDLKVGAGDDCAVVAGPHAGFDWVLTTDPLISGTHFLANEDPLLIGRKAVGRVLSDIAAMGAEPMFLLINIACPAETEIAEIEAIYEGASSLGSEFGAVIIGGDMAQGPVLELHVFGVGRLPADTALLRSGARAGDAIYVTGPLGGSFRSGKHLNFTPRVTEGIALRETDTVTAMMDLSDGLATDLRHICNQSHLCAELYTEKIPRNLHCSVENALGDGEDFELLFTAPSDTPPAVDFDIYRIGRLIEGGEQIILISPEGSHRTLNAKAFEHFSEQ
jgi:thiamine-monophosphate kinase